jgi:hypothetical protein
VTIQQITAANGLDWSVGCFPAWLSNRYYHNRPERDAGGWSVLRLNEFGETNRISFILWTKPLRVLRKFSILLRKSVWQGVAEVREGLSFCLSLPLDDLAGGSTAFGSPAFRFPCTAASYRFACGARRSRASERG